MVRQAAPKRETGEMSHTVCESAPSALFWCRLRTNIPPPRVLCDHSVHTCFTFVVSLASTLEATSLESVSDCVGVVVVFEFVFFEFVFFEYVVFEFVFFESVVFEYVVFEYSIFEYVVFKFVFFKFVFFKSVVFEYVVFLYVVFEYVFKENTRVFVYPCCAEIRP